MKKMRTVSSDERIAMRVSANSIVVNVVLSVFKLFAGIVAGSGAMISDAVHSASDVFSTFIVIIGVRIANKEADEKHQYGHERMECVASIVLAVLLGLTGIGIGVAGLQKITSDGSQDLTVPGMLALAAAVISIVVKEGMYWYTRTAARKINSSALMADAWHHRSDAMSSIGSFVGILGARMGFPILDPAASVIICGFIIKAAYDIFKDSIEKMTDESCDETVVEDMRRLIMNQDGVLQIDELMTRKFGSKIYVDIEIAADGELTLNQAHFVAEKVHYAIELGFPSVKHCMVHVNPMELDEEDHEENQIMLEQEITRGGMDA